MQDKGQRGAQAAAGAAEAHGGAWSGRGRGARGLLGR